MQEACSLMKTAPAGAGAVDFQTRISAIDYGNTASGFAASTVPD